MALGYSDWVRQGHALAEVDNPNAGAKKDRSVQKDTGAGRPEKLAYKEARELEALPKRIEVLEVTIERLQKQIAEPDFYASAQDQVQAILQELTENQESLDHQVERWAELEQKQQKYESSRV